MEVSAAGPPADLADVRAAVLQVPEVGSVAEGAAPAAEEAPAAEAGGDMMLGYRDSGLDCADGCPVWVLHAPRQTR